MFPEIRTALARAQRHLKAASPAGPGWVWMRHYSSAKLRTDDAYTRLAGLILPGSRILDLGCGMGLLELVLAARDTGDTFHGLEWDARKVAFAGHLHAGNPRCAFRQGDLREAPWPEADAVVLLDVLHYFPPEEQTRLLARIAQHLLPGGRLFLRVMDGATSGRSRLTRALEHLAILCRWNRAPAAHWRPLPAILKELESLGLAVQEVQNTNRFLAGNYLIAAERIAQG